jgi:hypothetical protein
MLPELFVDNRDGPMHVAWGEYGHAQEIGGLVDFMDRDLGPFVEFKSMMDVLAEAPAWARR